ncbi:MAG: transglycosylase SLT domain-containing protein [Candidatus Sericytochromatia bacterium]|nr:transglycosylase SLT domain-containing protein [Candidatus Sericytochromatia bacterium]
MNHRIQQGDTLWGLAQRYGTDVRTIAAANPHLEDAHTIVAGEELKIPVARPAELPQPGRDALVLSNRLRASEAQTPEGLTPQVRRWWPMIQEEATRAGVEPKLLAALVQEESQGDPHAVSWVGAKGLTQLMPETAREVGVTNRSDPRQSLRGGATYLKQQLDRFGGDEKLALAAYNAGAGNVSYYGGIPPFAETQAYVRKVMDAYQS